jgi:hypothetical protein
MKKINYLCCLLFLVAVTPTAKAQEVKLKNDTVIIDDKPAFSYDKKSMGNEFYLYKLNTKDEIAYMIANKNETISYLEDDFKKIVFTEANVVVESSALRGRSWKYIVELLLESKVLDIEGNVDAKYLERFVTKYDEKITQRTIRN